MNKRAVGAAYEEKAARHLEKLGYRILKRNYRCKCGEIDLIARQDDYLVFVEVKYRHDSHAGYGAEAVDWRKQQRIVRAARWYLAQNRIVDQPCRFDVVSFLGEEVQVIKDAFQC